MKCFLCQSEEQAVFEKVESFGYPLTYYQCQNCGLVFQSVEESMAGDAAFYQETYRKIYQSNISPTVKDLWVQKQRAAFLVELLKSNDDKKIEKVLDIGASTGLLLKSIQVAIGCDVTGVEPGDAYRQYAKDQGISMFSSIEDLVSRTDQRFDLVTMIHVLEHLPDPVGYLRSIRAELLNEKGRLLIEVPNFYAHDSYELAHLTCFTPHTLNEMLKQAGYRIKHMVSHGVPRSSLLRLYITVLAEPLQKSAGEPEVKTEHAVRFKRHLAMFYRQVVQKLFPHKAWLPLPGEKGTDQ